MRVPEQLLCIFSIYDILPDLGNRTGINNPYLDKIRKLLAIMNTAKTSPCSARLDMWSCFSIKCEKIIENENKLFSYMLSDEILRLLK